MSGTRQQVWNGEKKHTSGGLTKKDLKQVGSRLVSVKVSNASAKKIKDGTCDKVTKPFTGKGTSPRGGKPSEATGGALSAKGKKAVKVVTEVFGPAGMAGYLIKKAFVKGSAATHRRRERKRARGK
jgi:hypothetical protein